MIKGGLKGTAGAKASDVDLERICDDVRAVGSPETAIENLNTLYEFSRAAEACSRLGPRQPRRPSQVAPEIQLPFSVAATAESAAPSAHRLARMGGQTRAGWVDQSRWRRRTPSEVLQ